jgi:RimJ/RimL family protein N-acetyltransferase
VTQPVLRTTRLSLVPLADHHLDLEVELDSDPEVLRYLSARLPTRDEVIATHGERMALGQKVSGLGYWIAFQIDAAGPGDFVGLMMLPPAHGPDQPDDPGVADLGYRILRRYWRQGLATEASRALLGHAFATVGVRRVIAQTMAVPAA